MIPKSYHISKGAEDIYWILNHGESFVKNLSKDFDVALASAKQYVGDGVDIPVYVWHRVKQSYVPFEYPIQQDAHVETHKDYLAELNYAKDATQCLSRQFVGEVNKKLVLDLECTVVFDVENEWGWSRCVYFKDEHGNRFKYFGTAKAVWKIRKIGDTATLEFVIKEHKFEDKYFKFDGVVPYNLNVITRIKTQTEPKGGN